MGKKNMPIKEKNFPVGLFLSKQIIPVVVSYYRAARLADDITDNAKLSCDEKLAQLAQIEKDFFAQTSDTVAGELSQKFSQYNLSSGLYSDLLEAFRRDAKNQQIEIWEQLLDYCRYSAAPVGRFLLALHNESPATYLPAETLCTVLQIVDHIQDLKHDACVLRRCYIPIDFLHKYNVAKTDLCLTYTSSQLKLLINEIVFRLEQMVDDSKILLKLVKNRRLKAEIAVIFSLTNSMLKRIRKGDVIATVPSLKKTDWIKAAFYGLAVGIFSRTKSCNIIR